MNKLDFSAKEIQQILDNNSSSDWEELFNITYDGTFNSVQIIGDNTDFSNRYDAVELFFTPPSDISDFNQTYWFSMMYPDGTWKHTAFYEKPPWATKISSTILIKLKFGNAIFSQQFWNSSGGRVSNTIQYQGLWNSAQRGDTSFGTTIRALKIWPYVNTTEFVPAGANLTVRGHIYKEGIKHNE